MTGQPLTFWKCLQLKKNHQWIIIIGIQQKKDFCYFNCDNNLSLMPSWNVLLSDSFKFSFTYVCVYACVSGCVHIWWPEVHAECLLLSTLFETGSFIGPKMSKNVWLTGQWSLEIHLSLAHTMNNVFATSNYVGTDSLNTGLHACKANIWPMVPFP